MVDLALLVDDVGDEGVDFAVDEWVCFEDVGV